MSDIFISYKREDQAVARALAESLEEAGWSVWWDPQIRAGERFDEVIERELKNAKCVIVVWSRRSVQSQYVKDEANYAMRFEKLIPVAIDKVSPPFRFQGLQTLFLSDWQGSASSPDFQKLLVDIENAIGPPLTEEAPTETVKSTNEESTQRVETKEDEESNDDDSILGATATYGQDFKETQVRDIYSLRIYVNLFAGAEDADKRVKKEIEQFLKEKGYDSYEIIKRQHSFLRGYYEYTVQFKRK